MARRLAVVALVPYCLASTGVDNLQVFDWIRPIHPRWLAVARRDEPTVWGLPGGKVEGSEDLRAAIARETLEETGVNVLETTLLKTDVNEDFLVITFLVTRFSGYAREMPGEGRIAWQEEEVLSNGRFGAFNARRFTEVWAFVASGRPS